MCGRYNIITSAQGLYDAFKIISSELKFDFVEPNYNVHPSPPAAKRDQLVTAPIIRLNNKTYEVVAAIWPLIPKWAKGTVSKYSTANAKAETLDTTKSYQSAWTHAQRCLIPATGFYEWQVMEGKKQKQPYNITLTNQSIFAMAGLWEHSMNPEMERPVESFTIITTEANPMMAEIHNTKKRMPVILSPESYQQWLTGSSNDAKQLLTPFSESEMTAQKITTYVNNPHKNDEKCVEKL